MAAAAHSAGSGSDQCPEHDRGWRAHRRWTVGISPMLGARPSGLLAEDIPAIGAPMYLISPLCTHGAPVDSALSG